MQALRCWFTDPWRFWNGSNSPLETWIAQVGRDSALDGSAISPSACASGQHASPAVAASAPSAARLRPWLWCCCCGASGASVAASCAAASRRAAHETVRRWCCAILNVLPV
jgi:hypothetical protein